MHVETETNNKHEKKKPCLSNLGKRDEILQKLLAGDGEVNICLYCRLQVYVSPIFER